MKTNHHLIFCVHLFIFRVLLLSQALSRVTLHQCFKFHSVLLHWWNRQDQQVMEYRQTCSKKTASHTHTHTLSPGLPGWAGTRKVKLIWILLKQETVSGTGISWVICKSAPRSRQITTPAPHHSVFYRPDALTVAQPTVSKH